jgi:2'-5' RNA ligase
MFHRLPGEYQARIVEKLVYAARGAETIVAEVSGVRHLGAGVAFSIESPELQEMRALIKSEFVSWLGSQDIQKWQPHITVQNKSSKPRADELYRVLSQSFQRHSITITGLDLWEYLGGPWRPITTLLLNSSPDGV